MKRIFSVAALLAIFAGSAFAADLPSYKAPPPPPLPPPPLWTGFYIGLNAGGTWASNSSTQIATVPVLPVPAAALLAGLASGSMSGGNSSGFIGGGQIGYNWQFFNGAALAGVEADIQGIAQSNNNSNFATGGIIGVTPVLTNFSLTRRLDYIGTVRGRVGWLFTPTLLLYGTGGLAYGGVTSSTSIFQAGITNGFLGLGSSSFSDTRVGWTAGGGLEWMFMPHWSAKVEYLYYDLGNVYNTGVLTSNAVPSLYAAFQQNTRFNGNIVRAGVNYHFNWGAAPVVAKY
ncbi:MAG: outer membrane protein [Methylocystis sp.]|uniref:outer membrane protein n=1 Tax=Methylocystis sp. TaxID=1911079 RepID=UPI003D0A5024